MMSEEDVHELDLQLGDALREIRMFRRQRDAAMDEALRLRHTLEHIHAKTFLAIQTMEPIAHEDKDSY